MNACLKGSSVSLASNNNDQSDPRHGLITNTCRVNVAGPFDSSKRFRTVYINKTNQMIVSVFRRTCEMSNS